MDTADFDYDLPPDRVAAAPTAHRDEARLLVLDRESGQRKHARFFQLLEYLPPRALLVLNDTRVFPARIRGTKETGGGFEVLLVRRLGGRPAAAGEFLEDWEAMTRGLGANALGKTLTAGGMQIVVGERQPNGLTRVALRGAGRSLLERLDEIGDVPLPPYIEAARRRDPLPAPVDDRTRYQTVFAAEPGAVAAPTAGLHFTPELLAAAARAGHEIARVTLHVGPGTFRPVETDDPAAHRMDAEHYRVPPEAADAIARARRDGRRVVAVGTTVVRTLEACARAHGGEVVAEESSTDLFLMPGARFEVVTDLITNFHLPRSTLLMLVAAFAGRELILEAYAEAVRLGYRFYSYGDAMLITGDLVTGNLVTGRLA
ncbi:MAG TPA: tRNA preQ1(34) S-adenosylmethionine ribosyltransferase-isomerase QueA [Polyangia bacterium]|nr:tRNA preQ1(34) S-adenosylmethionine ribosyltransferase-isomerase QueA [Polyangia bacterium]